MTVTYEGVTEETRQIIHHHAVLRRGLERRAGTLCEAVESGVPFEWQMKVLREYIAGEILPHAAGGGTHPLPGRGHEGPRKRLSELVGTLTAEHHALAYLAARLHAGADGREAATAAEWIATLFAGHVAKVNDLLLPALIGSGADLASLLADMREQQPASKPDGA